MALFFVPIGNGWQHCLLLWLACTVRVMRCTTRPHTTVSGQSAGGSMAIQHLFAFSESVDGAAIAAGAPYGCGALPDRKDHCYYGHTDIEAAIQYVHWRFRNGEIDDPSNLWNIPIVLFNGRNDYEVYTKTMRDTYHQILAFADARKVETQFTTSAAHVWSLDHGSCNCGECGWFSASLECCDVNNCNYDLSGNMLRRFYGSLNQRRVAKTSLRWIDQWKYLPEGHAGAANESSTWHRSGMWRWGFAYVPTSCEADVGRCRVHVNYHGCINKKMYRRRLWATSIDINEYAEANDIIVLYPQASGTVSSGVGCWNWGFAEDDPQFDTRESVQLRTVMNLIEDLENALQDGVEVDNAESFAGDIVNSSQSFYT
eukprot:TRINITY_DN15467_c0_g1_i1.p1 TRINITY_DN15467_c0_g1~~TRINITY_DN15467_c0_g1_i1.p1  ORF type:complete len:391 (+),score=52.51 TRINITY_DN15467_c0_g1_i1:61-1173(+)